MDLQLDQKHVVVTGASSGIGAAIAAELDAEGARVTVLDLAPPVDARAYVNCDLSDADSIHRAAAEIEEPLFGLVNSAGLSGLGSAEAVMSVNALGLRELTELLLPRLESGGAIVNIASGAGMNWRDNLDRCRELLATPTFGAGVEWVRSSGLGGPDSYFFSKEVVVVYTLANALRRFAHDRVRMNSISPGPVETPLLASFHQSMDMDILHALNTAAGGDGKPEEIAKVAAFLLSPAARWVNGTDISLSGGANAAVQLDILDEMVAHAEAS